jgi:hypothetical protein
MHRLIGSVLAAGLCAGASQASAQDPGPPQPLGVDRLVCYRMVQDAGRWVAWARWEQRMPIDVARLRGPANGAPQARARLIDAWMDDAYRWQPTDEQVREWAEELGSAASVPHANELTVHETIAIWLRRTARACER